MRLTVLSGATRGLGYAIYKKLLEKNEPMILVGRRLNQFISDQSCYLSPLGLVEVDLVESNDPSNATRIGEMIDSAVSTHDFKRLVFISNAGVVEPIGLIGSLNAEQFMSAVSVNFVAPTVIAGACAKVVGARNATLRVLNISSGAAIRPIAGWAAYCATKAAARMYFDVLATESDRVDVRHIDPGVIDTDMQATIRDKSVDSFPLADQFIALAKEGKLQSPDSVAERILQEHFN